MIVNNIVDDKYQEATDYFDKKDFENAEIILRELLSENQNDFDVLNFLGIIKLNLKSYKDAIELFESVVELCPQHGMAYYNLGLAYQNINENDLALQSYLRSLEIQPNYVDSLNNIGVIYLNKKDYAEAESYFNEVMSLEPDNVEGLINIANLNIVQNKYEEAIEILSQISSIKGENLNFNKMAILTNLGISKLQQGKNNEALEMWNKVLALTPDNEITNYNIGHVQLLAGDFKNGWKNYEWRKKRKEFIQRKLNGPELIDQDINGKTVFVYDEQGLGDSIQFVRYLKLLKQKNCKIIFECDPRLIYLFNNYEYLDKLIPRINMDEPNIYYDYQISLLSLPRYFKTDIDSIPFETSYLKANKELVSELSTVIKNENILNVGIVWGGNSNHTNDKNRSCPLENFKNLFELSSTRFFSLQKGKAINQLRQKKIPFIDLDKNGLKTFAHTAAIIENLDLVISVDTSVAHLAGALGKPTWVLLPFLPDWRWMMNRNDSPWYPSMKLFRQEKAGDWKGVFKKVVMELQKLIDSKLSSEKKTEEVPTDAAINQSFNHSNFHSSIQSNNNSDADSIINSSNQVFNNSHITFQKEKSVNTNKIYLGLTKGSNYGWGIVCKYMKNELSKMIGIHDFTENGTPHPDELINSKFFQLLTDIDFNPLYNQRGKENYGYTVFESELNEKSIENSKKYDKVVVASTWCKEKLEANGIKNNGLIIQGIDTELFFPVTKKGNENLFVIFSGGKMELRKGQDLVLKAFQILHKKYPDMILLNAWYNFWPATMLSMSNSKYINFEFKSNDWHEFVTNLLTINDIDPQKVFTLPLTPNEKLREIYAKTDIGLFPNRCEGGTNLVLMEYMACGKPVIASYNTGHKDVLNENNSIMLKDMTEFKLHKNSKLIADWEEASIDEIVSAVETAYQNRNQLKILGQQAALDMNNFTWKKTAINTLKELNLLG